MQQQKQKPSSTDLHIPPPSPIYIQFNEGSSHWLNMGNPNNSSSPKYLKTSSHSTLHSTPRGEVRCIQPQQSFRLHSESEGLQQGSVHDKYKGTQKPPTKESNKPMDFKLHTQMRAIKRAGFNDMIATKINIIERQRQLEEKLHKIIEEEEIRMLRKEMVPRAQLMPLFDKPFFPQRSARPLTVPREPSFHILNGKCWSCLSCNEHCSFQNIRAKL